LLLSGPHRKHVSNNSFVSAFVFVAAVTFLPSHFLAKLVRILPSHSLERQKDKYADTDWWEGCMKYAVDMDSRAMMYIPGSVKTGLSIQTLMGSGDTQTRRSRNPTSISLNKKIKGKLV
jgi:hypothetical protein